MEVLLLKLGVSNKNRRIYTTAIAETIIEQFNFLEPLYGHSEEIFSKNFYEIDNSKASFKVNRIYIDYSLDHLMADITMLDEQINESITFFTTGNGEVNADNNIVENYKFIGVLSTNGGSTYEGIYTKKELRTNKLNRVLY